MKGKIQIDPSSIVPFYKQLVEVIKDLVNNGVYKEGDFLPSRFRLADELNISKETVQKAYSVLRDMGIVESAQGKGFYISGKPSDKIKMLLLFDKISTYKQVLFNSFAEALEDRAGITIHLHNQDIALLKFYIEQNFGKYDYYVITPHFPLDNEIQRRAVRLLKKIPNRKLILLDRYMEDLPGNYGSVYQDFEGDIYDGLTKALPCLSKYRRLNVISMAGSLYAPLIEAGIKRFSSDNQINIRILKNLVVDELCQGDFFLILNGQLDNELIQLIKEVKEKGFEPGKDIGIISYNESPINDIILNGLTVFSTDFKQMGELAAKMILERSMKKIRCNFNLIRRNTF